uniref:Uncharacterized protein n=1 Tax=viral metagenome TaxID=1070528 RepID=A0A6C0H5R4_9ZZZZ
MIKIKKIIIVVLLIILVIILLKSVKEGYTSCTQANSNCQTCTSAIINGSSSGCYWNPYDNKCGSFNDNGYFKNCSEIPNPLPTNPTNSNNYNRILHRLI